MLGVRPNPVVSSGERIAFKEARLVCREVTDVPVQAISGSSGPITHFRNSDLRIKRLTYRVIKSQVQWKRQVVQLPNNIPCAFYTWAFIPSLTPGAFSLDSS